MFTFTVCYHYICGKESIWLEGLCISIVYVPKTNTRSRYCVIEIILILFFSRGFVTFDKMEAADQAIAEVSFLLLFVEVFALYVDSEVIKPLHLYLSS
jgi:hypothetical protein